MAHAHLPYHRRITTALLVALLLAGLAATLAPEPVTAQDGAMTGVTISNLNTRAAPERSAPLIGTIPARVEITLEARNGIGDWVLVHTLDGGLRGWVVSRYLIWPEGAGVGTLPVSEEVIPTAQGETLAMLEAAPVIPAVTGRAREIYQHGLSLGNHADRFSKVGDCQSVTAFFLSVYDDGSYTLGDSYAGLQPTIDHFAGSWGRDSASVWSGFTIFSVLDPIWANPDRCEPGETPQACEYRLWQPSFVFISLEVTNGITAADYDASLRQILDFWIGNGVVPILATKADNYEGDWSINAAIARAAWEYDIPLWNFLMAVRDLEGGGIEDGFHLTFAPSYFDNETCMEAAWPWRNLTALQTLDSVWRGVQ